MSKTALLFPGQGSQSVGMMNDLGSTFEQVKATFADASRVLGYDLWDIVAEDPKEQLNKTEITQPAVLTAGIATWRVWRDLGGPRPDMMAGHSLGEYSALVAADALGFEDAVMLVAERGRRMQEAVPEGTGAMAAIVGLSDDDVAALCEAAAEGEVVSCANYNSPGQVVIAGSADAVARAREKAGEAGAKMVVPLAVSVPSHCALMQPAADKMAKTLAGIDLQSPSNPVLHNADVASYTDPDQIKDALVRQLWQPVRWTETILTMTEKDVSAFAECGPGKVLAGLNRRINRRLAMTPLMSQEAIEKTIEDWS